MLFDSKDLKRDFILVEAGMSGQKALEQAGTATYLVISFPKHRYAVVKPDEFRFKLRTWKITKALIADLPAAILEPHWVQSLDVDQPGEGDDSLVESLGDDGLLVVRQGDEVVGLLVGTPKVRKAHFAHAEPPSGAEDFVAGTLSTPTAGGTTAQPAAAESRHINVEMRDRDEQLFDPAIRPLVTDQVYTLLFDVDTQLRSTSIARTGTEFKYTFKEGEQKVEITVRLETDDFEIFEESHEKKLIVPRAGRSLNRASFLIQPKHDGPCQATAVFLKEGAFVQVITLKFMVGELFSATTLGHDVGQAFVAQPRDVSLTIVKTAADAYQLILVIPGTAATATLRLKDTDLKDIAEEARASLMEVVYWKANNKLVYQAALQIAPDIELQTRQKLAETGYRMFQRLFASDEQSKNLGAKLRSLAQQETLKIQIFAQDFVFPWALLYMDKVKPGAIDAQNFLGMKHIIEHIPLQQSMLVTDNKITDLPGFNVSLNLNTDVPLVSDQVNYWKALQQSAAGLQVVTRNTKDAVLEALASGRQQRTVILFLRSRHHPGCGRNGRGGRLDAGAQRQRSPHTKGSHRLCPDRCPAAYRRAAGVHQCL